MSGQLLVSQDFPYGQLIYKTGSITPDLSYAGMLNHEISPLKLTNFRIYDPNSSRWLSRDPIAEVGGLNLYSYVQGNPISFVDPLGLMGNGPGGGGKSVQKGPPGFSSQAIGAWSDFQRHYNDMRTANTIGADKYFHCKANCQAARRGPGGDKAACMISDTRKWVDQNIKGNPASASASDQFANISGRSGGATSQLSCEAVCDSFRPYGLSSGF